MAEPHDMGMQIAVLLATSRNTATDWNTGAEIKPKRTPYAQIGADKVARPRHHISLVLATTSVVTVKLDNGPVQIDHVLNGGTAIPAGSLYEESFIVPEGFGYNIQHTTTNQIVSFWVVETFDLGSK